MGKRGSLKKIKTSIGGQALMEGIMMRGPKKTAIAVRLPNKEVYMEERKTEYIKDKYKIFNLPLMRGIGSVIDSLKIGHEAMMISAQKATELGEEEKSEGTESKFEEWLDKTFGDNITKIVIGIGSAIGICLSIFLFFFLPSWIYNSTVFSLPFFSSKVGRSTFEGIIKLLIFLLYMFLISKVKDIKRVFQYHGAEHKTIFCYENREALTVENVKKFRRFHPRCGTSFIVLMLIVGIFVGIFIPFRNSVLRAIFKILCIPLFASLGFELIRLCAKYDNILTRAIAAPGLWMQRISTAEPTDDMIEVAIKAMEKVIPENGEDQIDKDSKLNNMF